MSIPPLAFHWVDALGRIGKDFARGISSFAQGVRVDVAEGAPDLANDTMVSVEKADAEVIPFTMDAQDTFLHMTTSPLGAYLVIVAFAEGEAIDKEVIVSVTDPVSEPTWEPPRPWTYDPVVVSVRNGFVIEIDVEIKID